VIEQAARKAADFPATQKIKTLIDAFHANRPPPDRVRGRPSLENAMAKQKRGPQGPRFQFKPETA